MNGKEPSLTVLKCKLAKADKAREAQFRVLSSAPRMILLCRFSTSKKAEVKVALVNKNPTLGKLFYYPRH